MFQSFVPITINCSERELHSSARRDGDEDERSHVP